MARKKSPEKPPNHERWLVSYGDFITLLFAVVVTLYAMSQTDKKKVDEVAASYRSAFGFTTGPGASNANILRSNELLSIPALDMTPKQSGKVKRVEENPEKKETESVSGVVAETKPSEIQHIKKSLQVSLKPLQLAGDIAVEESSRGLVVRLDEDVVFDLGSANIRSEALPLLGKIARAIAPFNNQIRIEGHTDDTPVFINRYQSNTDLSIDRATSIWRVFVDHYDMSPAQISLAGYGQYRPIAGNDSEDGRKKNRRIDIVLLAIGSEKALPQ